MDVKEIFIHLGTSGFSKPGTVHLLAAPADYAELAAFLSSHFDTLNYTHDELGFPDKVFRCPAGKMFVRDSNGKLVSND